MNRQILLTLSIVWLCLSCTSEDDNLTGDKTTIFKVSKAAVSLASMEGSATISIESTYDWNATVQDGDEWISLSPTSGDGNGPLRIKVNDNSDGDSRSGKVQIITNSNEQASHVVVVNQLGASPDILLSYSDEPVLAEGGEVEMEVVANVEWEVFIDESIDWISLQTLNTKSSYQSTNITFSVSANTGARRSAEVEIRAVGEYSLSRKVKIEQQESVAFLAIERTIYELPYKCETLTIPVDFGEYETQYVVNPQVDWITWDKDASTHEQIVLQIKDNDQSDFPREAVVQVVNVSLKENLSILQYGKPNPRIGDDVTADVLAFPGAEGGGRFVIGGRGGKVYHVTNLLDYTSSEASIPGSIRYGIDVESANIIVFDVSGNIELKRSLGLNRRNISLIGQTAPGDGITFKNFGVSIDSDKGNAVIRFLRFRPGDSVPESLGGYYRSAEEKPNQTPDFQNDCLTGRYFEGAIVDHVSASWGIDECFSFYGVKNFTAQWVIVSESLNCSFHGKGAHGYGAMFSGDNASFHHILVASHGSRNPRISDLSAPEDRGSNDYVGYFDVRNIVMYNWSSMGQGAYGGKLATFNYVNNYYRPGPATDWSNGKRAARILSTDPTARIFAEGSVVEGNADRTADNWLGIWNEFDSSLSPTEEEKAAMKMDSPQPFAKVTTHTAQLAYNRVTEYAGNSFRRDAHDKRIIQEMLSKTATYVGSVTNDKIPGIIDAVADTDGYPTLKSLEAPIDTDTDGIPDIWEDAYGLNKDNANDANTYELDNMNRYNNLEVYFHNLVQHIVYYQNQGGTQMEKL
ncbi:MAG: BACON domain-containing protein [Mangrovibacterium sp.]